MTTAACRGFVYATAVMGVTGARTATSDLAGPLVAARARDHRPAGRRRPRRVSNGDQAAEVASYADGVIVGSAFVRALLDHPDDRTAGLRALAALTEDLAAGVRRALGPSRAAAARAAGPGRLLAGCRGRGAARADERLHGRRAATSRTTSPTTALTDTDGASSRWPPTPTSR